jgi:Tol biopolymer transport system component
VSDNVEVRALDGRVLASDVIPAGMQGSGDQRPGWSPDGSAIVLPRYRFGAGSGGEPWVLPLDGAAPRPLSVEAKGYRPAFSPDGTRIAIDTEAGLILTAADGTGAQMLLTGPGSWPFVKPLWSPDGTRIAVSYKEGGTAPLSTGILPESIQVVNVATGATVTIHTSSGREVTAVDWSTDGRAVLVVQGDGNVDTGQASVWSVPADGSGGHLVVERAHFEGPDWR